MGKALYACRWIANELGCAVILVHHTNKTGTMPKHQRQLEIQARNNFYASGGDRNAYLAFMPFDSFGIGFIGYVTKSELSTMIMNKTKNPAES